MKRLSKRFLSCILALMLMCSSFVFASAAETSLTAAPASPDASSAQLPTPYTIEYDKFFSLYVGRPQQMTHYRIYEYIAAGHKKGEKYPVIEALNKLPKLPEIKVDANAKVLSDMLFIDMNGNRRQIYITANALHVGGKAYRLSNTQYYNLLTLLDDSMYDGVPFARWLLYINPHNVTKIVCTDQTGRSFEIKPENMAYAANYTKNIEVSYGITYKTGTYDLSRAKGGFKAVMYFKNDTTITMYMNSTTIYLESSDMSYGCRYSTDFMQAVSDYFKEGEKGNLKTASTAKSK